MATKKTSKKKSTPVRKRGVRAKSQGLISSTEFVAAVEKLTRGSRTASAWPPERSTPERLRKDLGAAMDLLLQAVLRLDVPEARRGDSLEARLAALAAEMDWPRSTALPAQWNRLQRTARFVEISLIADHLLRRISSFRGLGQGGGGSSSWPPHGSR